MQQVSYKRDRGLSEFGPIEREIAGLVLDRLAIGSEEYGEWDLDDDRDNLQEALEELIDSTHYIAAELVRLRHKRVVAGGRAHMRRVYVCHRFSSDRLGANIALRKICRALVQEGCLPIAAPLYLPLFIDEDTERELALRLCQELVRDCDELRVYGRELTAGMRSEISFAGLLGIPVHYVDSAAEVP